MSLFTDFASLDVKDLLDSGLKAVNVLVIGGFSVQLLSWRKDSRERRALILKERDQDREDRAQLLKELEFGARERQARSDRIFALDKQARDALDQAAIRVADAHYRPVMDAIVRVNLYADTFQEIESIIAGAESLMRGEALPIAIRPRDREFLEKEGDLPGKLLAMREGLNGCGDILVSQLRDLETAVRELNHSGYVSELLDSISREAMLTLFNIENGGGLQRLGPTPATAAISNFLRGWKDEIGRLNEIREVFPWERFLVVYRDKLRAALGPAPPVAFDRESAWRDVPRPSRSIPPTRD